MTGERHCFTLLSSSLFVQARCNLTRGMEVPVKEDETDNVQQANGPNDGGVGAKYGVDETTIRADDHQPPAEEPNSESSGNEKMPLAPILDLDTIKDSVYFLFPDRKQRLSKFWLLLVLASIIATMGVAGDSTATVIGAMIVAPLMTPIMGTMLSIVLTDGPNFLMSITLVIMGAGAAIFIGFIFGLGLNDHYISKENNSQVAARVEPRLTALIGALATGAVGSIALVRKDIAGSLPGVAIAISLVPPLCVAGLTMSTGNLEDASGALLLFAANFASIIVVGVIVMYTYGVQKFAIRERARLRATAIVIVVAMLGVIAVPLTFTSRRMSEIANIESCVMNEVNKWGLPQGWSVQVVVARGNAGVFEAEILIAGSPPFPSQEDLPEKTAICDLGKASIFFLPEWEFVF